MPNSRTASYNRHKTDTCLLSLQDFFPRHVLLNGQPCQLRIGLNLNVPIPTVLPNGTLIEDNEQPVSVTLGQFIGAKGEPLAIKGINWCALVPASHCIPRLFSLLAWRYVLPGKLLADFGAPDAWRHG